MRPTKQQRTLLRSLRSAKGREESGLFLVEGVRLCEELASAELAVELALVAEEEQAALEALCSKLESRGATIVTAPLDEVRQISDTVTGQGILVAARWAEKFADELEFPASARVVALDSVGDPGNVGTVIRCADWFGADAVLLGKGCTDLLNPKTVRSTMGGMFHLPVCRDVPLVDILQVYKSKGFKTTAATMDGSPNWSTWCGPQRSLLLLGSEVHGISSELLQIADRTVTIPRRGRGDSLNVAVTAGILLSAL